MWTTPDYIHQPLYVIAPIYNPVRFKSRWKHYERFAAHVKAAGGVLVTIEAAFGERHHALNTGTTQHGTDIHQRAPEKPTEFHKARTEDPHQYIRVRTSDELWVKENLINLAMARLPETWKYVAWVDADVMFTRPNWVGETIHQLQHYKVVQMFSEVQDLNPAYGAHQPHRGFVDCHLRGAPRRKFHQSYYGGKTNGPMLWHPGFAWAARREAIDALGGLVDFGILGAGDNHMAHALIGRVEDSIHPHMHPRYRQLLLEWQYRAETHIRRNIGVVSGLLVHYWHGKKVNRKYRDRWKVLVENKFNPDLDIKRDSQGVWQLQDRLEARSIQLRDQIRQYFRERKEDGSDE